MTSTLLTLRYSDAVAAVGVVVVVAGLVTFLVIAATAWGQR